MARPIALALQGGGSHGAFTWGVLDRLLDEIEAGRLHVAAVSGTSAGAFNAALLASGLAQGGAALARAKLEAFWRSVADAGARSGNMLFFGEPMLGGMGPMGFNLDWSPVAIALEAAGLVVSPYTNPFYTDALAPLVEQAFPPAELAVLNAAGPALYVSAVNIASNARAVFTQPGITVEALRASACLPSDFRAVVIDGAPYWDGGYLGNPALTPLLEHADDLVLVLVNAFDRSGMPPRTARGILDRLNEITFNASVVLELNAIQAINRLLAELAAAGTPYAGRYRPVRLHAVRDDAYAASLGFVSKGSTSWTFLSALRDAGRRTAEAWVAAHLGDVGERSSLGGLTGAVITAPGKGSG